MTAQSLYDATNPLLCLPLPVREAFAVHEMFRRCKFPAEHIYVKPNKPPHHLQMVLRVDGRMFAVDCGVLESDCGPEFMKMWNAAIDLLEKEPLSNLEAMLDESELFKRKTEFLLLLVQKGFLLREETERLIAAFAKAG